MKHKEKVIRCSLDSTDKLIINYDGNAKSIQFKIQKHNTHLPSNVFISEENVEVLMDILRDYQADRLLLN